MKQKLIFIVASIFLGVCGLLSGIGIGRRDPFPSACPPPAAPVRHCNDGAEVIGRGMVANCNPGELISSRELGGDLVLIICHCPVDRGSP